VTRPRVVTLALYLSAAAVYALDRGTKLWAEASLAGRAPIDVIPGVLSFTYTTNSGGAFGLGRSAPWLFATATVAVSLVIIVTSVRITRLAVAAALGLILGGALGNLTDRAVNGPGLSGHVVDFVDLHVWPVFNVADSAIVVGAILLAVVTGRRERTVRDGTPGGSPPRARELAD
jgi:signal peptidase II